MTSLSKTGKNNEKDPLSRICVQGRDRIITMSSQQPREIKGIKEITFKEFYQSRLARIIANNQADYALQRIEHALRKPFYYFQFRTYQILEAIWT